MVPAKGKYRIAGVGHTPYHPPLMTKNFPVRLDFLVTTAGIITGEMRGTSELDERMNEVMEEVQRLLGPFMKVNRFSAENVLTIQGKSREEIIRKLNGYSEGAVLPGDWEKTQVKDAMNKAFPKPKKEVPYKEEDRRTKIDPKYAEILMRTMPTSGHRVSNPPGDMD